jgi:hypothetical protein
MRMRIVRVCCFFGATVWVIQVDDLDAKMTMEEVRIERRSGGD